MRLPVGFTNLDHEDFKAAQGESMTEDERIEFENWLDEINKEKEEEEIGRIDSSLR